MTKVSKHDVSLDMVICDSRVFLYKVITFQFVRVSRDCHRTVVVTNSITRFLGIMRRNPLANYDTSVRLEHPNCPSVR